MRVVDQPNLLQFHEAKTSVHPFLLNAPEACHQDKAVRPEQAFARGTAVVTKLSKTSSVSWTMRSGFSWSISFRSRSTPSKIGTMVPPNQLMPSRLTKREVQALDRESISVDNIVSPLRYQPAERYLTVSF